MEYNQTTNKRFNGNEIFFLILLGMILISILLSSCRNKDIRDRIDFKIDSLNKELKIADSTYRYHYDKMGKDGQFMLHYHYINGYNANLHKFVINLEIASLHDDKKYIEDHPIVIFQLSKQKFKLSK